MRRRSGHRLDMLPLLDVFMVVLFVFATIQEDRLDASEQDAAQLEAQLEDRERKLAASSQSAQAEQAQSRADVAEAKREAMAQQERVATLRAALREIRVKAGDAAKQGTSDADDALRRQEILAKLLDHFSVFEIEIAGEVDAEGLVVNRCCFRADVQGEAWTACGSVPARGPERADWLDDGADGLLAALRKTKGGNAVTVIRQDEDATYRIAGGLESALRERLPEHKLYNEGIALAATVCPKSPAPEQ